MDSGENTKTRTSAPLRLLERVLTPVVGPLTLHNAFGWLKIILAVLVVQWLFLAPYRIPSGSMEPTFYGDESFLTDDRIIADKWRYGLRIPFSNKRIFHAKEIERWDIVVFHPPEGASSQKRLIKRVVGLPGERVHIADGKIHINGEPLKPPPELADILYYTTRIEPELIDVKHHLVLAAASGQPFVVVGAKPSEIRTVTRDVSMIRERVQGQDLSALTPAQIDAFTQGVDPVSIRLASEVLAREFAFQCPMHYGVRTEDEFAAVPDGHYFVLGDNSAHSADGRIFGWLPNGNILGRAFCIWWPLSRVRDLTGFSSRPLGQSLLFGIPALFVLYELTSRFLIQSFRTRSKYISERTAIEAGEEVLINLAAFGIRAPFSRKRMTRGREPVHGEIVAFFAAAEPGQSLHVLLGRVEALPGAPVGVENADGDSALPDTVPEGCYLIPLDAHGNKRTFQLVEREHLMGSAIMVWRPFRKLRRLTRDTE